VSQSLQPLDPLERIVEPVVYRIPTFDNEPPVDIPLDTSSDFPGGEL
jgi:hypothetical protein